MKRRLHWIIMGALVAACASGADAPSDAPTSPPPSPIPPAPAPVLVVSADSVAMSAISGAAQTEQSIAITSGTTTPVSGLSVADVTFGAGQAAGWLVATLSAQTSPATLVVAISAADLVPGSYDAIVRLGATGLAQKQIAVHFAVRARPRLSLDRSAVAVDAPLGGVIPVQTIGIVSVGGAIDSLSLDKPICESAGKDWLAATLDSGDAPATLSLAIAPDGLGAGIYTCSVTVSTSQKLVDSAAQAIRVTMTLRTAPVIRFSTDSVSATAVQQADAAPVSVAITNAGTGTLIGLSVGPINYGGSTVPWLTTSLDSTTAPATLTLRASAKSLAPGWFYANVPVLSTAAGVVNSPKSLLVSFLVSPTPPALYASPHSISFTKRQNDGSTTLAGTVSILATGGTVSQIGLDTFGVYPPWISIQYMCTAPTNNAPCTVLLLAPPNSLPPGTYTGSVLFKSSTPNVSASFYLTLTVTP